MCYRSALDISAIDIPLHSLPPQLAKPGVGGGERGGLRTWCLEGCLRGSGTAFMERSRRHLAVVEASGLELESHLPCGTNLVTF